jgi:hypothetical protein
MQLVTEWVASSCHPNNRCGIRVKRSPEGQTKAKSKHEAQTRKQNTRHNRRENEARDRGRREVHPVRPGRRPTTEGKLGGGRSWEARESDPPLA